MYLLETFSGRTHLICRLSCAPSAQCTLSLHLRQACTAADLICCYKSSESVTAEDQRLPASPTTTPSLSSEHMVKPLPAPPSASSTDPSRIHQAVRCCICRKSISRKNISGHEKIHSAAVSSHNHQDEDMAPCDDHSVKTLLLWCDWTTYLHQQQILPDLTKETDPSIKFRSLAPSEASCLWCVSDMELRIINDNAVVIDPSFIKTGD